MMIFDSFRDLRDAAKFAAEVHETEELHVAVYTDAATSQMVDPFPYELVGPVVHVDREDRVGAEERIRDLVEHFGGRFAGT